MKTIEEKAQAYAERKFQEIAELYQTAPSPEFRANIADLDRQRRIQGVVSFGISNVIDDTISDPARLLTQHSMTPFWIEDRKRERLNNAIFDIEAKISAVLKDFENTKLKLPTFDNHCPNRWEQVAFDIVFEAFVDLEEQIKDLLAKFIGRSANQTWELWECHGFNDTQYIRFRQRQRKVKLRSQLRKALYADIYSRFSEQSSFSDDDLPF